MARIYTITDNATGEFTGLVRAANKTAALRHVAEQKYSVRSSSQEELVTAIALGAVVQDATQTPTTNATSEEA